MKEQEKIRDPHTGEWFIPKRSNQKFASAENRIAFNNAKAQKRQQFYAPYLKKLKRNYDILNRLLGEHDTIEKSEDFLEGAGYNINIITGYKTYENYRYCMVINIGVSEQNHLMKIRKFES